MGNKAALLKIKEQGLTEKQMKALESGRYKGKKMPTLEKHYHWKGDDVKYSGLHGWVYTVLGNPSKCVFCGKLENRPNHIDWANKSGEYKREKDDWLRLCRKCHIHYDKERKKCN